MDREVAAKEKGVPQVTVTTEAETLLTVAFSLEFGEMY